MLTNTKLLTERVEQSGISNKFIAEKLGITTTTWRYKREGKYPFNQSEIQKLCEILHITRLSEKEDIFFHDDVC